MPDKLLNWESVTKRLGISRTTLWRWMRDGKIPAPVAIGSTTRRWRESDVDRFIATLRRSDGGEVVIPDGGTNANLS